MVGFLLSRIFVFSRRRSQKLRLGAKGSCNQGKRRLEATYIQSDALRILCYWRECSPVGAITIELCSMAKCALWGLRVEPLTRPIVPYVYPCNLLRFLIRSRRSVGKLLLVPHSSSSSKEQELKIITVMFSRKKTLETLTLQGLREIS